MIKRTDIKGFGGKIIGFADIDTDTGVKTVRTFQFKIVATYDPRENLTRRFNFSIVGEGDLTMMALQEELANEQ